MFENVGSFCEDFVNIYRPFILSKAFTNSEASLLRPIKKKRERKDFGLDEKSPRKKNYTLRVLRDADNYFMVHGCIFKKSRET